MPVSSSPAGSSPVRVKSLDDDDVVLVAPFDEEVAGEGSGSPEFPLANDELHAAEVNHNHVGHHTAHSSNERFRAQTVGTSTVCLQLPDRRCLLSPGNCIPS